MDHSLICSKSANVLAVLGRVASQALDLTGYYYTGRPSVVKTSTHHSSVHLNSNVLTDNDVWMPNVLMTAKYLRESLTNLSELPKLTEIEPKSTKHIEFVQKEGQSDGKDRKEPKYHSGVLRKNCIDSFDRKNVAQYAYGLGAVCHQLFSLSLIDNPKVDPYNNIADALMDMYQNMGDALALQYGGSTVHNPVFL